MAADRTVAPEIRPFAPMSIPDERVEVLPNGLTLHTYSGGDQPVCRLVMLVPYSAASLPSQALPTLLPMMILAGNRNMTAEEIDDRLDFCGVRPSGKSSPRYLQFTANMLTGHAAEIFMLLAETYSQPAFDASRLEACKTRVAAGILTSRSQPITLATEKLNQLYYGPDNWKAAVLMPEQVAAVTAADLRKFHSEVFKSSGIHLYLSGLIDEETIGYTREAFGAITADGPAQEPSLAPAHPVATPCAAQVAKPDSFQSAVTIGIPSIGRNHPDYISLRYTVMALGGYFGSRLMSNIREDKGLTYHISAVLMGEHNESMALVSALCDKSSTEQVVAEISEELRRLAANPPEGEELSRLKLHAMTDLAEMLDNPANVMSYYITQLLVGTPVDYFAAQQQALRALTPEIISDMAARYLTPEKMITVTTV
ncbi:MAG: insulinase family protein [Bacteroidales bacterium]|nr:insulinase family protein [Bacteroidales bacterium]